MVPWARRLSPWGVDVLLGLAVTLALSVVIASEQGGQQRPDAVAYLWAVGLGALMLMRQRFPRLVLGLTAFGLFAYYAAGYPAVGVAVPVAAALFSAAEAGRLVAALTTAATVVTVSVSFRLLEGQEVAYVLGYDLVPHLTLMAAAVALGDSLRSRRASQAQQREITELTARQYAREVERRAQHERLDIARDLHDSIGHAVAVISLHSDVAREALGRDELASARALDLIKEASRQAMRELRRTVTLLRTPGEPAPTPGALTDLNSLTRPAQDAGIQVETEIRLPERPLPLTVERAAYRIVQEAVTNVIRHSGATRLRITLTAAGDTLRVEVVDNGSGNGSGHEPARQGRGLPGMAERARALGGALTARREPSGFTVRADLPLPEGT